LFRALSFYAKGLISLSLSSELLPQRRNDRGTSELTCVPAMEHDATVSQNAPLFSAHYIIKLIHTVVA
jgi:hypothetical protein